MNGTHYLEEKYGFQDDELMLFMDRWFNFGVSFVFPAGELIFKPTTYDFINIVFFIPRTLPDQPGPLPYPPAGLCQGQVQGVIEQRQYLPKNMIGKIKYSSTVDTTNCYTTYTYAK